MTTDPDNNLAILAQAAASGQAIFFGLLTMPNGHQFNVTAEVAPERFTEIGKWPRTSDQVDGQALLAKLEVRGARIATLQDQVFLPALNVLIQAVAEAEAKP